MWQFFFLAAETITLFCSRTLCWEFKTEGLCHCTTAGTWTARTQRLGLPEASLTLTLAPGREGSTALPIDPDSTWLCRPTECGSSEALRCWGLVPEALMLRRSQGLPRVWRWRRAPQHGNVPRPHCRGHGGRAAWLRPQENTAATISNSQEEAPCLNTSLPAPTYSYPLLDAPGPGAPSSLTGPSWAGPVGSFRACTLGPHAGHLPPKRWRFRLQERWTLPADLPETDSAVGCESRPPQAQPQTHTHGDGSARYLGLTCPGPRAQTLTVWRQRAVTPWPSVAAPRRLAVTCLGHSSLWKTETQPR